MREQIRAQPKILSRFFVAVQASNQLGGDRFADADPDSLLALLQELLEQEKCASTAILKLEDLVYPANRYR